jgi:hypothetical protein
VIAIFNTKTKTKDGKTVYQVQINDDLICRFKHKRSDGLGICLLEASKAVERAKWKDAQKLIEMCTKGEKDE